MGSYTIFYCKEKMEWIEPGNINDGPMKVQHVMHHAAVGQILMLLLTYGPHKYPSSWDSVAMTTDSYPLRNDKPSHEEITELWMDVTKQAIEKYNEFAEKYEGYVKILYTSDKSV